MGWLAGCWGGEKGTTRFREIWTVASPDLVLGINVTTRPSKPAEFEYLRIESRDGRLALVPQPGGAPPTRFELSAADSTADTAMFVNLQHDFPKRIAYRKVEGGVAAGLDRRGHRWLAAHRVPDEAGGVPRRGALARTRGHHPRRHLAEAAPQLVG